MFDKTLKYLFPFKLSVPYEKNTTTRYDSKQKMTPFQDRDDVIAKLGGNGSNRDEQIIIMKGPSNEPNNAFHYHGEFLCLPSNIHFVISFNVLCRTFKCNMNED